MVSIWLKRRRKCEEAIDTQHSPSDYLMSWNLCIWYAFEHCGGKQVFVVVWMCYKVELEGSHACEPTWLVDGMLGYLLALWILSWLRFLWDALSPLYSHRSRKSLIHEEFDGVCHFPPSSCKSSPLLPKATTATPLASQGPVTSNLTGLGGSWVPQRGVRSLSERRCF